MGTFRVTIEIGDPQGKNYEPVDALVDSGATFNTLPASMLRRLGVSPQASANFAIADGSRISRGIGDTWVRIGGEKHMAPVVFGDENARPLLGAVTLELFRLGIDPVNMRLVPIDSLL